MFASLAFVLTFFWSDLTWARASFSASAAAALDNSSSWYCSLLAGECNPFFATQTVYDRLRFPSSSPCLTSVFTRAVVLSMRICSVVLAAFSSISPAFCLANFLISSGFHGHKPVLRKAARIILGVNAACSMSRTSQVLTSKQGTDDSNISFLRNHFLKGSKHKMVKRL